MRRAVCRFGVLVVTVTTMLMGQAGLIAAPAAADRRNAGEPAGVGNVLNGVVQDVVVEASPGSRSHPPRVRRVVRTAEGTVELAEGSLPANRSGDQVRLSLAAAPDRSPAGTGRPRPATVTTASTRRTARTAGTSPGKRSVYVAFVAPKGSTPDPGLTPALAADAVAKAGAYWASQTSGLVTLALAGTKGWTASPRTCQDVFGIWDDIAAGWPQSQGSHRHLLVVVPRDTIRQRGCHYGFATIGSYGSGGFLYTADLNQSLVAHEIGHNFGLHHANSLTCRASQDGLFTARSGWASRCREHPYDDVFDVMGYSGPGYGEGNLNGPHLDVMALNPGAVRSVGIGSTQATIAPLSATSARSRVLRVVDPAGGVYYVEYRTASGRDVAPLRSPDKPSPGVRIVRADPQFRYATGSHELDATPGGSGDYDRALRPGSRFTSASGRVQIQVLSADPAGARVLVQVAGTSQRAGSAAVAHRATVSAPRTAESGGWVTVAARVTDRRGKGAPTGRSPCNGGSAPGRGGPLGTAPPTPPGRRAFGSDTR